MSIASFLGRLFGRPKQAPQPERRHHVLKTILSYIEAIVDNVLTLKGRVDAVEAKIESSVASLEAKIVAEVEAKLTAVDPAVQAAADAVAPKVASLATAPVAPAA